MSRVNAAARRQAPWMLFVQPGDVLQTPSGDMRIVRAVSRFADGDLRCITFAIRRCSWTGRAYTCKTFTDVMSWTLVACRPLPTGRLDKRLAKSLSYECRMPEDQRVTCCDVVGVMP